MTAVIEVGSTYQRKVGDNIEAVTINRACDWGGWYGTDSNGNTIRVTEKSLILSDNNKEDNHMASTARVTAADRRARRGVGDSGSKLVIEISDSGAAAIEEATGGGVKAADLKAAVAKQPARKAAAKPAAKKTTAKPQATKPAAKPAPAAKKAAPKPAKKAATPAKPKEAPAKKATAKRPAVKPEPNTKENITVPTATAKKPAARRTRLAKPAAAKAVPSVILTGNEEKTNSWQFKHMGDDANPLVTTVYVTHAALAKLEKDGKLEVAFGKFTPGPRMKQTQPTHSIRFTEQPKRGAKPAFQGGIYIMRPGAKKVGITEDTDFVITVTVESEDSIKLSFAL